MDDKQIINQRQLAWLTASIISSGGILTMQNVIVRISRMDAWLSYLLPIAYLFVIASFFAYLSKRFPHKHIFEISMLLLGRWGGTCLNLVLIFHCWTIVNRDICSISKFTTTVLLERTPFEVLVLLPCLLLMYYGRTSVEIIARVNDIFYPLFIITIVCMPFLLANEINWNLLRPMFTMPPTRIASANFVSLGSIGDMFMLGAFLHTIQSSNLLRSSIRHGSILGIGILTVVTLLEISVLGPKMPGNFLYPPFNVVQMIHITDFLDRVDLFILIVWLPTMACKILAVYVALLLGISSLLKKREYPVINKPTALLIAITTLLSFRSATELFAFSNFSAPVIVLGYQPIMILILIAAIRVQERRRGNKQKDTLESPMSSSNKSKATVPMSARLSYKGWLGLSNGLLATAAILAISGLMYGRYMPGLSRVNFAGYLICIALLVWSTFMELAKLKQLNKKENAPAANADTSM